MKALWTFALCVILPGIALATPVATKELSFQYVTNDGGISLACVHSQIRDLPDWEVVCGKGTSLKKKYTVHFVTKQYHKSVQPLTTLEYLYWVTEWESAKPVYNSNSFWISLKEKVSLHSIRLYQGIENDYADLVLDYSP